MRRVHELRAELDVLQSSATSKYDDHVKALAYLSSSLRSLRKGGGVDDATLATVTAKLDEVAGGLAEVDNIRPSTGSYFVRAFLGQVNVKASSAHDRLKLRDEYNKFKDRTNIGFIVFPLVWVFTHLYLRHVWRYTHWIHVLTHVWLLYYYVSLSLRENILRVNGSNIRPWWITHHYVSSVMSITVLTWPTDSASWESFTPQLTAYFLYQGLVQVCQARYQKARHYARRAMGKANAMDVAHTETLTEFHAGLYVIVVLVVVAHIWQVVQGVAMFQLLSVIVREDGASWWDWREEVQCVVLGVMFVALGLMNFVELVQTLWIKWETQKSKPAALGGGVHQSSEKADKQE